MDQGDLVPDQVTIDMLEAEVDQNPQAEGFIFDGFPRTEAQAEALDVFLKEKKGFSQVVALEKNLVILGGHTYLSDRDTPVNTVETLFNSLND